MPKSHHYFIVQSWLVQNKELFDGENRFKSLQIICKKLSETLNIPRVGVWLFSSDQNALIEEITVIAGKAPTQGHILFAEKFKAYVDLMSGSRIVHFKNREEIEKVLGDYEDNVVCLLDTPIYSDGIMVGTLCVESFKTENWTQHDEIFVATCADLVGRVLEAEKRQIYSKELNQRIIFLEHNLKKRIAELHEANNDLEFALDSAEAGRWTLDFKTGELSLDKAWFEKVGITGQELPRTMEEFVKIVHPDDRERVLNEVDYFKTGSGEYYETRYRLLTKKGIQWCMERGRLTRDKDGRPERLAGMNFDITALVHWERDLSVSEAQLKSMIQSIPSPMAMLDRNLNMVAYSNRWVEEWSDYIDPHTYVPNRTFHSRDWMGLFRKALDGVSLQNDEECLESNDSSLWIRWLIKPWRDSDGLICGVVIMLENITNKKEAEMKLTHASKLSALGEMAGGIAHEINNPLSIIKGYLDLIKRHHLRGTLDKDILDLYLGKMDVTVGRISRIVNGMKRFSRESSMDEKNVYSIIRIIEDTFDICQERIYNNGILLELIDESAGAHDILCRPVEISQVILNLINNSFYAVSDQNHPWIKVKLLERNGYLIIEVSDSGSGIDATTQQKLFQPFFTTKEVGEGTGLGLSISKGIVEEHGGKIYYDPSRSSTTFVIELPLVNMEDIQTSQRSPSQLNS